MKEKKTTQAALVLLKPGKDGKERRAMKTYTRVNSAVENASLYDTMKKLGALQAHPVKGVRRMTVTEMTEEA